MATVAGFLPGCVCSRHVPAEAHDDFGAYEAPPPDAKGLLALARAVLQKTPRPAADSGPGRRVMLAFWRPGAEEVVTTGKGATVADSVVQAAEAMATKVPDPSAGRIELDVPTSLGPPRDEDEDPPTSIGIEGVFATRKDGKTGFVLPGEIIARGLLHQGKTTGLETARIATLVAARAGVGENDVEDMRVYRFRADVHVESPAHDAALPVFRGMVAPPPKATPDLLLRAVRAGAEYLARAVGPNGRYDYLYVPREDRVDSSYGWLRHSGATYALLEAYGQFGTPSYRAAAERALDHLKSRVRNDPASRGAYVIDGTDEEQQKSGGAGLALIAFAEHAAVTGDRSNLELMRSLARFIVKQQQEDGHFRSNADVERETGEKLKREVIYYQGEATLALLRLYALDPQQQYVDVARRSADWVVHVRDANTSEDNQEHDHWICYALNDLYRVAPDPAYLEHAQKIARAIVRRQKGSDAAEPDLVGTYWFGGEMGNIASTRVEAFDSNIVLSRFAGKPDDWLIQAASKTATWMLGQQFDADDDYWLKNPSKAEGGVRESLLVSDVRIDTVQHAMSAWLHLARILSDPDYGKTGVPSQDPVK
ncbi:MAG TPA: beta-L-arabinofuranosidase domain-containing protein [Polyangiaceae bacterium]